MQQVSTAFECRLIRKFLMSTAPQAPRFTRPMQLHNYIITKACPARFCSWLLMPKLHTPYRVLTTSTCYLNLDVAGPPQVCPSQSLAFCIRRSHDVTKSIVGVGEQPDNTAVSKMSSLEDHRSVRLQCNRSDGCVINEHHNLWSWPNIIRINKLKEEEMDRKLQSYRPKIRRKETTLTYGLRWKYNIKI
jgi:hypothetical protein